MNGPWGDVMKPFPSKAAIAAAALLVMLPLAGVAADTSTRLLAAAHFTPVFPLGDFHRQLDATPLGGGVDVLWKFGRFPLSAGFSVAIQGYGWRSRDALLSPDIPEVLVRVGTSNLMLLGHFVVRWQATAGALRPYVEGLAGITYLWTQTSVDDHSGGTIATTVNLDDAAFSFGGGAGVLVDVVRGRRFGLMLDAGARFLAGGRANYLRPGELGNRTFAPNWHTSRTDLIEARVGMAVDFGFRRRGYNRP